MTKFTSVDQMEKAARNEEDSITSVRIRGEWLSVERILTADMKDRYEYKWGKNTVDRSVAINVLSTASHLVRS